MYVCRQAGRHPTAGEQIYSYSYAYVHKKIELAGPDSVSRSSNLKPQPARSTCGSPEMTDSHWFFNRPQFDVGLAAVARSVGDVGLLFPPIASSFLFLIAIMRRPPPNHGKAKHAKIRTNYTHATATYGANPRAKGGSDAFDLATTTKHLTELGGPLDLCSSLAALSISSPVRVRLHDRPTRSRWRAK